LAHLKLLLICDDYLMWEILIRGYLYEKLNTSKEERNEKHNFPSKRISLKRVSWASRSFQDAANFNAIPQDLLP